MDPIQTRQQGPAGRIIVVCGPTATGKTELATRLCRIYNGEMVGADSMQVYKGLRIGTAVPDPQMLGGIPSHLIGCLPPEEPFSVADYVSRAESIIGDILRRNAVPVVCGGTGLYISSLVNGIGFTKQKTTPDRRIELQQTWEEQGAAAMLARLARLDPEYAARLHPNDKNRILRALEESERDGSTLAQRNAASRARPPRFDALLLGLSYPMREDLYLRTDARVDAMLSAGLLEEAEGVYQNRQRYKTAAQAIGYKELFPYFAGEQTLENCIYALKKATRNYAKRQLTWFKRTQGVHWLDADASDLSCKAQKLADAAGFMPILPYG